MRSRSRCGADSPSITCAAVCCASPILARVAGWRWAACPRRCRGRRRRARRSVEPRPSTSATTRPRSRRARSDSGVGRRLAALIQSPGSDTLPGRGAIGTLEWRAPMAGGTLAGRLGAQLHSLDGPRALAAQHALEWTYQSAALVASLSDERATRRARVLGTERLSAAARREDRWNLQSRFLSGRSGGALHGGDSREGAILSGGAHGAARRIGQLSGDRHGTEAGTRCGTGGRSVCPRSSGSRSTRAGRWPMATRCSAVSSSTRARSGDRDRHRARPRWCWRAARG